MLVLLNVALVSVLLNEYITMIMMTVEHGRIKRVAYSEKNKALLRFPCILHCVLFCLVSFRPRPMCKLYTVWVHCAIHALYGG